jgi:hypothetical protein
MRRLMDDIGRTIRVRSIADEDAVMGHCLCGNEWEMASNSVMPWGRAWVDAVGVACADCGRRAVFTFDVSLFFEPRAAVWSRMSSSDAFAPRRRCAKAPDSGDLSAISPELYLRSAAV